MRINVWMSAAAMLVVTTTLSAQAGTSADLGKRVGKSKYALGHIAGLQELGDGRVVVSDSKEQVFRLVDFSKGEVTLLDKPTDDPDAFSRVAAILRLPGDSLGFVDPAGRRILHASNLGVFGGFVPVPTTSDRRVALPMAVDANGGLYFNQPEKIDTATKGFNGVAGLLRMTPGSNTEQLLLTYRMRGVDQPANAAFMPYFFRDAIAVRHDGLVARVVADTYQVIWSRDGHETGRTGPLPFTQIPIPAAEQAAIKDSSIESMRSMMTGGSNGVSSNGGTRTMSVNGSGVATTGFGGGGGGGGSTQVFVNNGSNGAIQISGDYAKGLAEGLANGAKNGTTVTPGDIASGAAAKQMNMKAIIDQMAAQPQGKFPDYKPPMPQNGAVALFDNNGMLWVARERVHGDLVSHYDIIAEGKGVVGHANIPAGARLVGFGKNAVYVARMDDGTEWLEKYARN